MVLEVIYVVRHGYRSNWVVDPVTGTYSSSTPTPTGIAADPALASYGVEQSKELAAKIVTLDPPVDVVYSSPFYRCIQTLGPTVEALRERGSAVEGVRVDNGISEFFGTARFTHPAPASLSTLRTHFSYISPNHTRPCIIPARTGESITTLHNRYAYAMHRLISTLDAEEQNPRAALLCTHAAGMLCIGRALTGKMPDNIDEADFKCGTCALSIFVRRKIEDRTADIAGDVGVWDETRPDEVPDVRWKGRGVGGGWDCVVNGDCSHLANGEEKIWTFSMEFSHSDNVAVAVPVATSTTEEPGAGLLSARENNSVPTPTPGRLVDVKGEANQGVSH